MTVPNVGPATDKGQTPRPALSGIYKQLIEAPAAASTTAFISSGVAGPNTTTVTYEPGDVDMDGALGATGIIPQARNVVVTVAHASSVVAMSGTITGKDKYGRTVTEAWSVTATGTSKTFTGAVAFKEITSITMTAVADASGNTITFGTGKVFGLDFKTAIPSLVKEMQDAAVVTNGVVVAASDSANADRRGTYTPNGTPNGTIDWTLWYIVDDFVNI